MAQSKKSNINTLGYLGPSGSFSESVALELRSHPVFSNFEFIMSPSLTELFEQIVLGNITTAVFPIKNSKGGLLKAPDGETFLAKLSNPAVQLKWVGEKLLPLKFCLASVGDSSVEKISRIHMNEYSQTLCAEYLVKYPCWIPVIHPSSSMAAQEVARLQRADEAALSSAEAVKKYSLQIIERQLVKPGTEPVMHFVYITKKDFNLLEESGDSHVSAHLFQAEKVAELVAAIKASKLTASSIFPAENSYFWVDFAGKIASDKFPEPLKSLWRCHLGSYVQDKNNL